MELGMQKGFSAINNILFHFEKSDANVMKILRFGKAGTMYRQVDHTTF